MDQETITEAPGNDSGADTNAGILSEADLASSFLERVEEQPEEKPSETEATDQTSENDVAEAEEDSEGNVLSQSEQSEETEIAPFQIFQSVFSEKNLTVIVSFCKFCINRNKRNDRLNTCSAKIHSSLG